MLTNPAVTTFLFGRLGFDSLPIHEPILLVTFAGVAMGGIAVLSLITYFKLWGWLWRDWITSVDHKFRVPLKWGDGGKGDGADSVEVFAR